ncbi:NAD(P)/FAD-dependent oxidoreductase [Pelagibacterium montanilacus]|uniref:NAD(P)/FAD-dependent oxidoreductase n=1 Tax=Pelagibacterium montanilacus TaxID=2185280 RepID=UPI000F8CC0F7|nr:NAD(P)/FAD-dependent oxidoreductase [Pelagibacterium montanilacus]
MDNYDVVIVGAGAAGMMCAAVAAKRGRSVLVVEHTDAPGAKIRISGGGRCNFTNTGTVPGAFLSGNPRFAISALKRYRPADFIALVERYGIAYHDKGLGQLFCDGSARQIIDMLVGEMEAAGARMALSTSVGAVEKSDEGFRLALSSGPVTARRLVVASGGKSIPKMGATGWGLDFARQFGLAVTETRPALVPLTFEPGLLGRTKPLSGISVAGRVGHGKTRFDEAVLFTHRGLSGPAILQISSYWREGEAITVDLAPGVDAFGALRSARASNGKQAVQTVLGEILPRRLAQSIAEWSGLDGPIGGQSDKALRAIGGAVNGWTLKPVGSEGYRTAEVMLGGVDTAGLESRTMEARAVPGLHFVGEAVDVTGWLGGYNFQWAWSSGFVAGEAV